MARALAESSSSRAAAAFIAFGVRREAHLRDRQWPAARLGSFQSAVEFAPAGAEFQMTDVNPSLGHPILDIRTPDQALGRFDLVLCCNVLEHIDDLGAAVSGLASVCEDEGMVFASTPFVYPYHDEPGDFWRPTAYGLKFIFEREFADVVVTWTGLRRFPFQLFVHARGPRR